jgi:hypothetical protein
MVLRTDCAPGQHHQPPGLFHSKPAEPLSGATVGIGSSMR